MIAARLTIARPVDVSFDSYVDLSATPWRQIILNPRKDIWCLVDAVDYDWLSAFKWNVSWGSRTPWQLYAKRNVGPARDTLRMHREIMIHADPRAELFMALHPVDHGNGQTLDNRRANLGWVTPAQNRANKRPRDQIPSLQSIVAGLLAEFAHAGQAEEIPF